MITQNIPVSIHTLADDATIPDPAWMDDYWATRPGRFEQPSLPRVFVRIEQPSRYVCAYRDTADGWLWTHHHPAAPLHRGANWESASTAAHTGTLVRHPLTPERDEWFTAALLDEMSPVDDYPTPPEATDLFRRAGWYPSAVARLAEAGYVLTDPEDAAVFASRPPAWWGEHGWPLPIVPRPHQVTGLSGRDVARLLDAGVDGRTAAA